jgi:hypothetical protein
MEMGKTLQKRTMRRMICFTMFLFVFSTNFVYALTDPDVGADDFTIVIIPDSQFLVQGAADNGELFKKQIQWILDNKDTLKIKMVLHVGDMVHFTDPNNPNQNNPGIDQWYWAKKAINQMDGNLAYLLAVGNHEVYKGDTVHYN